MHRVTSDTAIRLAQCDYKKTDQLNPLQEEVKQWFREIYDIIIEPTCYANGKGFWIDLCKTNGNLWDGYQPFSSYELALEAGINIAIDILKEGNEK